MTPTAQGFSAPSLRAAISFANSNPGGNVIDLMTPGVYKISIPNVGGVGEDQNQTGDFDILPGGGNLTIDNTSGGPVTVSGGGLDRVFDINPNLNFDPNNPTPKFTVTMEGFTITDGYAFSPNFTDGNGAQGSGNNPADVVGGAIRDNFNASLTLENMNISGNVLAGRRRRHLDGEPGLQHSLDAEGREQHDQQQPFGRCRRRDQHDRQRPRRHHPERHQQQRLRKPGRGDLARHRRRGGPGGTRPPERPLDRDPEHHQRQRQPRRG